MNDLTTTAEVVPFPKHAGTCLEIVDCTMMDPSSEYCGQDGYLVRIRRPNDEPLQLWDSQSFIEAVEWAQTFAQSYPGCRIRSYAAKFPMRAL